MHKVRNKVINAGRLDITAALLSQSSNITAASNITATSNITAASAAALLSVLQYNKSSNKIIWNLAT